MQDSIQREILINASKEKVYEAIANPELVVKWFPNAVEGKYEVGESPLFSFGKSGKAQVYIVEAKPHEYFSYRWVPGSTHFIGDVLSVPNTLVEFKLEEIDGATKVTLTESGFAQMQTDEQFKQNSGGWDFMLGRLVKLFQQ